MGEDAAHLFQINAATGEVKLTGCLDYETVQQYELNLQAKDPWGLTGASKLLIDVVDVNDNSPIITMTSFSGKIQEDSPPGTVVALISVQDLDSGKNGQVHLTLEQNDPFTIKPSPRKYYTLVTDAPLDRENFSVLT